MDMAMRQVNRSDAVVDTVSFAARKVRNPEERC
jgi:hypothetical protein